MRCVLAFVDRLFDLALGLVEGPEQGENALEIRWYVAKFKITYREGAGPGREVPADETVEAARYADSGDWIDFYPESGGDSRVLRIRASAVDRIDLVK
jgi:hypothetical protein